MTRMMMPIVAAASLVACAAAPGAVAQDDRDQPRVLSVTGLGQASAEPDMAVLTIGVETQAATAGEALRKNSAAMRATIDKMKNSGIAAKDMQTANLSVNPEYNYERNRTKPEIIGFNAVNTLSVKLRDLDKVGAIVDEAVSVGANRLGGLSFSFADPEPVLNEARRAAVKNARDKASLYAEAAGVRLGPIIEIRDGAAAPSPVVNMRARMEMVQSDAAPIETGESMLRTNVTLVYEIR